MADKRRPTPPKRPAPKRAPARRGRPAGLFTWLAIGLVVIVVAALVIIKVTSSSPGNSSATPFVPTSPAVAQEITSVPASVFDAVGITSPIAAVTPPLAVKGLPALTQSVNGTTLPEVLYMGAEYCPYCAAQRWSTIVALSRFGTFKGLGDIESASGDVYPNTPSFTFLKAKYTSPYLVFDHVELYTNYLNKAKTFYAALQKPNKAQEDEISTYDTSKYIKYLTSTEDGSIPFISFGNKFLVAGASYSPTTLADSSRDQIAAGLSNASDPVTQAIVASANYQTAAICSLTGGKPGDVCSSSGVKAAAKAMDIK